MPTRVRPSFLWYRKPAPDDVRSIEEKVRAERPKKDAKRRLKMERRAQGEALKFGLFTTNRKKCRGTSRQLPTASGEKSERRGKLLTYPVGIELIAKTQRRRRSAERRRRRVKNADMLRLLRRGLVIVTTFAVARFQFMAHTRLVD